MTDGGGNAAGDEGTPVSESVDVATDVLPDSQVIDESERLKFARQVLVSLGVIAVAVFVAYTAYPDNTALQEIFELIKIGLLPLVTLVVSFYFARTER
jgi:hypothetical protein